MEKVPLIYTVDKGSMKSTSASWLAQFQVKLEKFVPAKKIPSDKFAEVLPVAHVETGIADAPAPLDA